MCRRAILFFLLRWRSGKLSFFNSGKLSVLCVCPFPPRVPCPYILSSSVFPTLRVWSLLERIYNRDRMGVVGEVRVGLHPIGR